MTTDAAASGSQTGTNIRVFSVVFVIVLLFVVYRSVLAPLTAVAVPEAHVAEEIRKAVRAFIERTREVSAVSKRSAD